MGTGPVGHLMQTMQPSIQDLKNPTTTATGSTGTAQTDSTGALNSIKESLTKAFHEAIDKQFSESGKLANAFPADSLKGKAFRQPANVNKQLTNNPISAKFGSKS